MDDASGAAQAAELDRSRVAVVVLAFGSPTAHNAILLRARGIPAVVAAGPAVLDIAEGTPLVVDGTRGEVITHPPAAVLSTFQDRAAELVQRQHRLGVLREVLEPPRASPGVADLRERLATATAA